MGVGAERVSSIAVALCTLPATFLFTQPFLVLPLLWLYRALAILLLQLYWNLTVRLLYFYCTLYIILQYSCSAYACCTATVLQLHYCQKGM